MNTHVSSGIQSRREGDDRTGRIEGRSARRPWTKPPPGAGRTWWLAGLLAAALTMGLTFAHVLELPQKMAYGPRTWTEVEHSLYAYFALVGGPLEILTVILLAGLAFRLRRERPAFWFVLSAAVAYGAALASWFALVNVANRRIGSWTLNAVPADWTRWRDRWEFGHATGFALMLVGFVALAIGILGEAAVHRAGRERAAPQEREPTGAGAGGYGTVTALRFADDARRSAGLKALGGLVAATGDIDGLQRVMVLRAADSEAVMVTVYDSAEAADTARGALRPHLGSSVGAHVSGPPRRWAGPVTVYRA